MKILSGFYYFCCLFFFYLSIYHFILFFLSLFPFSLFSSALCSFLCSYLLPLYISFYHHKFFLLLSQIIAIYCLLYHCNCVNSPLYPLFFACLYSKSQLYTSYIYSTPKVFPQYIINSATYLHSSLVTLVIDS